MLVWNEADLVNYLECVPDVAEHEVRHRFAVTRDSLCLEILIRQFDGDVAITLRRVAASEALFEVNLIDCAGVRLVEDASRACLEFAPAKAFGNRYDGQSPPPFAVGVSVNPDIAIRMVSYDA